MGTVSPLASLAAAGEGQCQHSRRLWIALSIIDQQRCEGAIAGAIDVDSGRFRRV